MGLATLVLKQARNLLTGARRVREHDTILPGRPPGTLPEHPDSQKPQIHVIAYSPTELKEADIEDTADIRAYLERWPVVWINVDGLGDTETIRQLGELFGLHGLALEDTLTLHQRPKIEEYEGHLFWVVRMLEPDLPVRTEQLSIFFDKNFVLTVQEHPGDCLDPVRKRIRESGGRVRKAGADYLAYCLVDAVIDAYFPLLDDFSERLEAFETEALVQPSRHTVAKLHRGKRDLLAVRRAISPLREAINMLLRDDNDVMSETTRLYLRDSYDHTIQILELVETYREITAGLLDVYLTSVSNRTNDIMKVLTIIATVFIPLSFLTGIYGMNFDFESSPFNMPELHWRFGYPTFLLLAGLVAGLELFLFWRKGWLGGSTWSDSDKSDV